MDEFDTINSNKKKLSNIVIDVKFMNLIFLLIYSFCFLFTPATLYSRAILLYPSMFLWLFSAILIDRKWIFKSKSIIFFLFAYGMLLLIDDLTLGSIDTIIRFGKSEIYYFVYMLFGAFYMHNYDKFNFKLFIRMCFALLFVSYLLTLVGNIRYPNASRDLPRGTYHPHREAG